MQSAPLDVDEGGFRREHLAPEIPATGDPILKSLPFPVNSTPSFVNSSRCLQLNYKATALISKSLFTLKRDDGMLFCWSLGILEEGSSIPGLWLCISAEISLSTPSFCFHHRSSMANNSISGSRPGLSLTPLFQISKDAQGSNNPIPLSPQWLLPKPGESKPGVGTGESSPLPAYGNHSDNTEKMHDQKKKDVFRPSLLDMETGRRDRWRDEERDTNSSLRKDRWRDGDKELGDSRRMDRWPKNSSLLRVKRLSENVVLPSRGSPLSAGYDLSSTSAAKVPARGKALIPTDLSIAIPEGTYARIAPRSGLTWKHSIDVGAGVIDADYRGPVGVILFNHSDLDFEVKVDDRIGKLIIQKIVTPNVMEVEDLDATVRGAGGFGNSLRVKRLSENAVLPSRGSPLSAGYDLSSVSAAKVPARGKALIPTDLSIAIPEGTYARIAPRSGLTWKHSIDVGEGVIDADYRGPVRVILCNHSDVDFEVKVGDRIGQVIIEKIETDNAVKVEDLDATVRRAGGFGNSFRVKMLSENAVLPSRGTPLSAGCDLSSASAAKVPARGKALIPTDLSIAIREGTYARIAPRSGLTWKHSIDVGGGVIDADYRGPVGVILCNHSDVDFEVKVGDRIAQIIIQKIMTPNAMEVEDLDATVRGAGGFGSTGVRACCAS